MTKSDATSSANNELEIIEQLQNVGEEYGLIHEADESVEQYANRILNDLAEMIGDLTEAQKNVLALLV
jgi:hypothetical protein